MKDLLQNIVLFIRTPTCSPDIPIKNIAEKLYVESYYIQHKMRQTLARSNAGAPEPRGQYRGTDLPALLSYTFEGARGAVSAFLTLCYNS